MTRPVTGDARDLRRDPAFAALLAGSYRRLLGRPLAAPPPESDLAIWLYEAAPFCLLAHDTSPDPIFIYANDAAQRRFGYAWTEFTTLPSRLSAEAPNRAERQRLLEAVARDGFIADYRGLRIAKSGQRFFIEEAVVWELRDAAGGRPGPAAARRMRAHMLNAASALGRYIGDHALKHGDGGS